MFFLPKNSFLATELKRGNENYKYFVNDYLGSVKTEKMKNLRFTECRMEASESLVYKREEAL
jgi:hypothetical protein